MQKTLLIILILVAAITAMTYSMLKQGRVRCSLCVNFNGHSQCTEALGPDARAAAEEAHRNACALLASGVTEVVACNQSAIEQLKCETSP